MPDCRVLLVKLIEFAFLKEKNGIEVILFNLPELPLERREAVPRFLRDEDRALVVVWVGGTSAIPVFEVFRLQELEDVFLFPLGVLGVDFLSFRGGEEPAVRRAGRSRSAASAGRARTQRIEVFAVCLSAPA